MKMCPVCGKAFALAASEVQWFQRRGLVVPKRCPDCRKQQRLEQDASNAKREAKRNA